MPVGMRVSTAAEVGNREQQGVGKPLNLHIKDQHDLTPVAALTAAAGC